MPTEVLATSRAGQQIARLHKRQAKVVDQFLNDLANRGCQALAYRLSGPMPIDRLCVKHLSGAIRVVVAFETAERAWVLLVGPHDNKDPILNVYSELYRLNRRRSTGQRRSGQTSMLRRTRRTSTTRARDGGHRDPRKSRTAPQDTSRLMRTALLRILRWIGAPRS